MVGGVRYWLACIGLVVDWPHGLVVDSTYGGEDLRVRASVLKSLHRVLLLAYWEQSDAPVFCPSDKA